MPSIARTEMTFTSTRYYGLDALRACMLLLGIVLHLSLPYTGFHMRGYFAADGSSLVLLTTVQFVHYFRMPAFFLIGGFFSALLWEREGSREFLRLRWKRIGIVWLAALAVMSPLMALIGIYNHFASTSHDAWRKTVNALASLQVDPNWLPEPSLHLWFLEYLMLFCVAAVGALRVTARFLPSVDRYTGKVMNSRFRVLALAVPTSAALFPIPFGFIPYPASLVPWLGVSMAYGWFYVAGWLMYRRRDLLGSLASNARVEKTLLPVFIIISVLLIGRRVRVGIGTAAPGLDLAIAYSIALFVWSTIIALIASFYYIKPRKWLPYLADASYWIYLTHFPFAFLMPAFLRYWSAPPVIKVTISAALILILLLAVYDRFVRYTVLGRALNGVRRRGQEGVSAAAAGAGR